MYRGKKNKPSNRSRILECIYRNAPIARSEIADETEITPATVTAEVSELLSEGVLLESEDMSFSESTSGRKKIPIFINSSADFSIGVEFTRKALIACVTDLKGSVVTCVNRAFSDIQASHINDEIVSAVLELIEASHTNLERFVGVGIAVPGHMDLQDNTLVTIRKAWDSFSPEELKQRIPLPVVCENNARCMALAEYLFHPERTPDSFALLHVGMGMFCANVVNGNLFKGVNYMAGEIGHIIANENGQLCECGKRGCLQTYCGENWLLRYTKSAYRNTPSPILKHLVDEEKQIDIDTITTAYSMRDPVITQYINDALKYLGIAASNITVTINPGKFLIHGQMFCNEDICRELMFYIDNQFPFLEEACPDNIEFLPYHPEDGAVGGSALAVRHFFIK